MERVTAAGVVFLFLFVVSGCSQFEKLTGVDQIKAENEVLKAQLSDCDQAKHDLQRKLQSAEADYELLKTRLSEALSKGEELAGLLDEQKAQRQKVEQQRRELQELVRDLSGISIEARAAGNAIVLEDKILFALGKASLSEKAEKSLDTIAQYLKKRKGQRIRIEGHTDGVPIKYSGWKDNYHLAAMRAHSVMSYLVSRGLPAENVHIVGFGPNIPVVKPERKTAAVPENRRVEILLITEAGAIDTYLERFE